MKWRHVIKGDTDEIVVSRTTNLTGTRVSEAADRDSRVVYICFQLSVHLVDSKPPTGELVATGLSLMLLMPRCCSILSFFFHRQRLSSVKKNTLSLSSIPSNSTNSHVHAMAFTCTLYVDAPLLYQEFAIEYNGEYPTPYTTHGIYVAVTRISVSSATQDETNF